MSDMKTEVERVKKQFNDADVKKRNIGIGIFVVVVLVIVFLSFKG